VSTPANPLPGRKSTARQRKDPPAGLSKAAAPGASGRVLRRDAERNRQRILAAARKLFAERGLDVAVEQIALAAGVGMGTLYRRFPTKEMLIDAIFEARLAEYVQLAERALEHDDAWSALRAFLDAALGLQARDRGLQEILASYRHGRRGVDAGRGRVGPLIDELVRRAQQQGTVRSDITAGDIAMIMWGAGGIAEIAGSVAPNLWRRYLVLILDALRTPTASQLPEPPLTRAQLSAAMSSAREHPATGRPRT
jgi:AcrR family transcriptional regulator